MATKERQMPKVHVRGDKLTVTIPARIRGKIAVRDGDEMEVTAERGRIVLTPAAEEPLPGELEAIREGEEEFARGETRRLHDVQNELGLPTK
jgi:AbrB family looped-hinge helix DNA binding protein